MQIAGTQAVPQGVVKLMFDKELKGSLLIDGFGGESSRPHQICLVSSSNSQM
jgi:hypothetical protein